MNSHLSPTPSSSSLIQSVTIPFRFSNMLWSNLFIVTIVVAGTSITNAACSSCLVSSVVGAGTSNALGTKRHVGHQHLPPYQGHKSALFYLAMNRLSTHFGTTLSNNQKFRIRVLLSEADVEQHGTVQGQDKHEEIDEMNGNERKTSKESKPVSAGMVGAIGVYKNFISPLLPPACRFLPTCSQYGVQAIEKFGPEKGVILIAWRLLRCSPFGGRGYDPPKWPPVAYNYGSY